MKKILVVDDMAVFREPIAASLRLAGYQTVCAADGEEALQTTRAQHPDLILLDVSMPKMDGITFLKHLRAEPAIADTRVILLTALSEKKYVIAAATFGVRDYLLKSRFRLADLLDRIKKSDIPTAPAVGSAPPPAISPNPDATTPKPQLTKTTSKVPRLLSRDEFLQKIEHAFQAKTLSGVVAQVISTANSPRANMSELAGLIVRDPMLSARVLRAANSASYASAGAPVTTIPEAIRKIGCATVRNVAAALGVFDCMPQATADGFDPIRYWQHSFAVAQLCEKLAVGNLADQSGLAYVIGLCHDLTDIFIRTQFYKEFQQVSDVAARTGRPKEELYPEMLGVTFSQIIKAVLKSMALPNAIREPIEIFHSPGAARTTNPQARLLWVAENYANGALLASSPSSELTPITRSFCRAAIGDETPTMPDPLSLRSEVVGLTIMLSRLSAADETKLLVPMFETQSTKIWVTRHPGMSEYEPISTALQSLTEPVVKERLPSDEELLDGLVVVAPSSNVSGFSFAEIMILVEKARRQGRKLSVLAITGDGAPAGPLPDGVSYRMSLTLSELSAFVAALKVNDSSEMAA